MRACEDCRAPATSHKQIGGILCWRCARCLAKAQAQAREDERRAGIRQELPAVEQLELWAA